MQYYNGSSYDTLYPNIPISAVSNWNNNIYNKTQVDGFISNLNSQIENLNENFNNIDIQLGDLKIEKVFGGKYTFTQEQNVLLYTFESNYFFNKKPIFMFYTLENETLKENMGGFLLLVVLNPTNATDTRIAGFLQTLSTYGPGIATCYSHINITGRENGRYDIIFNEMYHGSGSYVYTHSISEHVDGDIPIYAYTTGTYGSTELILNCYLASII